MNSPPPSSDPRLAALADEPYSFGDLERRLDAILDPVLSTRRTAGPLAQAVASLPRNEQDFILHWTGVAARTNPELAYQFASAAPAALARLDLVDAESWIIQAMDTYDREGLNRGTEVLKDLDEFAVSTSAPAHAQIFEEAARVLELFVCGLSGRPLRLDTAAQPYTDTETIFLPPRVAKLPRQEDNFRIYKVMATLLWAQNRYGTFNVDLASALDRYASPQRAADLFNYFETVRLTARIGAILPGLARDMQILYEPRPNPDPRVEPLCRPDAGAEDSLAVLAELYEDFKPPRTSIEVVLRWDRAMAVRNARIQRERMQFRLGLAEVLERHEPGTDSGTPAGQLTLAAGDPDSENSARDGIMLDGRPVSTPANVRQLVESIRQDLGDIPDEYLAPGEDGGFRPSAQLPGVPSDVWTRIDDEDRVFLYNEWDCARRHYRKDWCLLRELEADAADPEFVAMTLAKYGPQVRQLKRTFELLRGEDRLLRQQPQGNDIDFDAVVSAYADMKNGMELSDRLLTRRHRAERDLAVMFMVDMSGSTKGWINDAEREALVMLCEALEVLGDRYAIYGFSGMTRKRCEIYRIKRFEEPYDERVQGRISGIRPQDYTRMGAAIRHLTSLFNQIDARTKLLVTLSDGKPDDYSDNYRGEYGIEDTRRALIESHRSGIRPFCITIDHEARDYLSHLYGPVNWTLVNEVSRLPLKVADIYRRLTS